jgi:hypothetical protein
MGALAARAPGSQWIDCPSTERFRVGLVLTPGRVGKLLGRYRDGTSRLWPSLVLTAHQPTANSYRGLSECVKEKNTGRTMLWAHCP